MHIITLHKHTHTHNCLCWVSTSSFLWNELYNCKHTHIAGTKGSQSNISLRKGIHPLKESLYVLYFLLHWTQWHVYSKHLKWVFADQTDAYSQKPKLIVSASLKKHCITAVHAFIKTEMLMMGLCRAQVMIISELFVKDWVNVKRTLGLKCILLTSYLQWVVLIFHSQVLPSKVADVCSSALGWCRLS